MAASIISLQAATLEQREQRIFYSLVASCKLNKIDPFAYFRDVLTRISIHPAEKIDELLPGKWKKPENSTEKSAA